MTSRRAAASSPAASRGSAACSPSRCTARGRGRVPAARRPGPGRARRRSRPRRSAGPRARPIRSSGLAARRSARTPVGNWCAGVTTTTSAPLASSSSTEMPSLSTGMGATSSPASSTIRRWACQPGSSSATRSIPAASQPPAGERQALPEAGADHQVLGVGRRAASASQIVGQRLPQRRLAAGIAVADGVERRLAPGAAHRSQPSVAGEAEQVGQPRREVVGEPLDQRRRGGPRRVGADALGDPHRRPLAGLQVALGDELLVGGGDDAAGDPELRGERAAGGQPRPRLQAPLPHRVAQRPLELFVEGDATALNESSTSTGPDRLLITGTVHRASSSIRCRTCTRSRSSEAASRASPRPSAAPNRAWTSSCSRRAARSAVAPAATRVRTRRTSGPTRSTRAGRCGPG